MVAVIRERLQQGDLDDSLCQAKTLYGGVLTEVVPVNSDDSNPNELPSKRPHE